MTEQQAWLKQECEGYRLCSEQIVRFGIFYVNKEGDMLNTAGDNENRFTVDLPPLFSEELASDKEDYKDAKKRHYNSWKTVSWWEDRFARSFVIAFCLAWKRAGLSPSDRYFLKDLATLDPENHLDDVCLLDIDIPHTEMMEFDPEELLPDFDYDGMIKYEDKYNPTNSVLPGKYNPESVQGKSSCTEKPICDIILCKHLREIKGYKMATKMVNITDFVDEFGWIGWEDQLHPYEILANLEKSVTENWQKDKRICSHYDLAYLGEKCVEFQFSHFEINNDLFEESYSCVFACYKYVGTVK